MLRANVSRLVTYHNRSVTSSIVRMASSSANGFSTNGTAGAVETKTGHAEDVVLFSNKNAARLITLNRPAKLNSLNTEMVELITPRLLEYSKSSSNNVIILTSNSPKGLCAGGDVAACASEIIKGNPNYGSDFFQKEYNLNYIISTYPKPYVSIMDGITMGGGVGLSVHAPFRVVTEKTKLAMPEMDIGFFPDVGTTFFLPKLDDKIGYYYALTGKILNGFEAYFTGFGTHYVHSDKIPHLINRLSNLQPPVINDNKTASADVITNANEYFAQVNQAIEEFTENRIPRDIVFPFTAPELKTIKEAFSQKTFEDVIKYLKEDGSAFAKDTLNRFSSKPYSSLKTAFELLNRGAENTIKKQFELELVSATNIMNIPAAQNDFVKGVSHKLIEKIKNPPHPHWNEASTVTDQYVKDILSPSAKTATLKSPLIDTHFGIDYKQYPFHMGLPSNQQVADYITGNDGTNRKYLPTPTEVLKHFNKKTNNKLATEAKVQLILNTHGAASEYDNKYVTWKA
ncbi:mitochondrial enoyl-CoA hydratase [Scheffersomyces xylosifermentans]|uniref:mitochondrial enoyl-CoA hydratase n=1 Tax=Scheffersomyces xylosifermentans TaxID=1304137 RepID=UPI00315D85A6